MSKEVKVKEEISDEMALFKSGTWGDEIDPEDLLIGKVLLMQPNSKPVARGIANLGDFRNSLDNKLLGTDKAPMKVVIFKWHKEWLIFEDKIWKKTVPWSIENRDWQWKQELPSGKMIERSKVINFWAIVIDEEYKSALPVVIRLKGMSYNTGKKLLTLFLQQKKQRKASAKTVVEFTNYTEENDKGVFRIWDFKITRDATEEEEFVAFKWWHDMANAKVVAKVDEGDLEEEVDVTPGTVTQPEGTSLEEDEIAF